MLRLLPTFVVQISTAMATIKEQPIYIPLEGVESEHCALLVDNALGKVAGITSHKVELNNRRAVITTGKQETLSNAINAIRGLGYGAVTVKKTIPVLQMSCASCAISAESIIRAQRGVVNAAVNYASASVKVEYLPNMIQVADMKKVVEDIGYDLLVEPDGNEADSLDEIHKKNYSKLRFRAIGAMALSVPVAVIGMFFMNIPYANYIMWVLATPVLVYFGKDFFVNAWKQAKHRSANMDTLVALSTGVAYLFSVFNTLFPDYWHKNGLHGHVYFEASSVVIAFILLGKLLEEKAKGNTSSAIKKLMGLQPRFVTVVHEGGHHMQMPIEEVQKGATILVKPGEMVAVDGVITEGSSYVDESMLSGEPIAVHKTVDAEVFAGTINQKGSFQFRAEKVGGETMLAHIIRMVQDAQGSKAPVQKLVDKIAGIFVPVVMLIAIVTFAIWIIFGGENGFSQGLMALVTVLVIACPCALGLATPTAIMVGVGKGAEHGILIKDAESLELAHNVNVVILDKTGTITEGNPAVNQIAWLNDNNADAQILFSMERQSEHPLADAVVTYLGDLEPVPVTAFESITGKGATASVNSTKYYVGSKRLLAENNVVIDSSLETYAANWGKEAKTVIWFANSTTALAVLAIADTIKPNSAAAVSQLQEAGIEVYMLTGDNEATAKAIAAQAGIRHYKAGVLPGQKADFVKELQQQKKIVAMVGDGINDSTALAQADVSIAMGKGSDIAMDVARMTIISSDLTRIAYAIRLSRQTVRAIHQNLFWAFIYNLIGIPIAAGILYPFNGFLLNPMIAGAAMALSSVSVVSNSIRLKWSK
jgi:P-type Cu2+ transporter